MRDSTSARCVRTNLDEDFHIQDSGTLLEATPASTLYEAFTSNYDYGSDKAFDGLISYISGSTKKEEIGGLFSGLKHILEGTIIDTPEYYDLREVVVDNITSLESTMLSVLPDIGKLEDTRKGMGTDKGKLSNMPRKKVIQQIGDTVKAATGIDMLASVNKELLGKSLTEKVTALHAFLNITGYRPDRHLNKIGKIPNVRYDGEHIANAIFCDYLLSEDSRLIDKAQAIYDYLGLHTKLLKLILE